MNKLQCLFAVASLIMALLVVSLIVREYDSQWHAHQEEYKSFLQNTAKTTAQKEAAASFTIGVRQDWLPEFNQADRCRSCHIGVNNPGAPALQPLASHPGQNLHSLQKFGCTVCHGGEGYATRLPDAHEEFVPKRSIESSCGKCHDPVELKQDAPTYFAGQQLAEKYNCNGCHDLTDRKRRKYSGPALKGLSVKVSAAWLAKWLKDPKQYLPHSRMGNFLLPDEDIQALTGYLVSTAWKDEKKFFTVNKSDEELLTAMDDEDYYKLVDDGKVLFGRLRCLSCHSLHGRGGTIGPELENIGNKSNASWIRAWLRFPPLYDKYTVMPTFRLTRTERLGIAEYLRLESEYIEDEDNESPSTATKMVFSRQQVERGKKLFVSRGCFNCHEMEGIPDSGEFAPSLADLANKKVELIHFGEASIPHSLPDYIAAKLQAPRVFAENLKMPFFDLPADEVGRLTTFALAQASNIPAEYNRKTKTSGLEIGGEAGQLVDRYRCLSCHKIKGNGGTLAPDLSAEGSKVNKDWLVEFLLKPYAIRPFLVERMPRFNLTRDEAIRLADFIIIALRDKTIDSIPAPSETSASGIGKKLYYEKYNCQNCHAIGTGGGYFGPALDPVGQRLRPNWMNARLKNAHRFEPDAREPVLAIPESDRMELVMFLSTLKGEKK